MARAGRAGRPGRAHSTCVAALQGFPRWSRQGSCPGRSRQRGPQTQGRPGARALTVWVLSVVPATMVDVSTPTTESPSLSSFWHDLPREGRLLLSTVVIDALGTGFVLPFAVVYLHEVRDLPLETVGVVLAVPAVVALLLLGPIGSVIDRFGPGRVQVFALAVQLVGSALLGFVQDAPQAAVAMGLIGVGHAAFWPASQSLVAAVVPSAIRQRYYGTNFTLLNAGIGLGGLGSGLVVSEARPWTFTAIYLLDAVTFIAPLAVLAGPLRHVGNAVPRETAISDD